ncbi:MAG: T9SS type A sorting domain-containing protein, partial [Bacteroidales bacterium]|nr:T9SS type A sorting domain-containing protein [Bacteroidales bacterium]
MKKLVLLMLAVFCVEMVEAQLSDTVRHRNRNYYYSQWFDTCSCCYNGTESDPAHLFLREIGGLAWHEEAFSDYTPEPLEILGVALMVKHEGLDRAWRWDDTNYGPEYVYVGYYDSINDQMLLLDSARWDTVPPKTMEVRLTETPEYHRPVLGPYPGGLGYCYVYEAYFEKPVVVDSVFYMIGSLHSNRRSQSEPYTSHSEHREVIYQEVTSGWFWYCSPNEPPQQYRTRWEPGGGWRYLFDDGVNPPQYMPRGWGPFIPIIRPQSLLEVRSADSAMGQVTGGGIYMDSVNAQIEAIPEYGYVFSHWNDGDTSNPRHVTVTCDTTFTAYFAEAAYYRLAANAYPPEYGTVVGGGYYPENTDTVIVAEPFGEQYRFLEWDDHDTANPRRVRVERDTMFTAVFEAVADTGGQQQGIGGAAMAGGQFRLVPNPATEEVRCLTAGEEFDGGVLKVVDVAGREVLRRELPRQTQACTFRVADYPSGTYFVTLTTAKGTSTQKLVV